MEEKKTIPKQLKRINKSSEKHLKSSKIAPKTAPETFVEGSWYQDIIENRFKNGPGDLLGELLGHLGPKSQHSSENPGSRTASWASSWRVKSIKIGPRWTPTSIDFSTYFWDRFFIDFGIILGSKMESKSMKNRCWKGLILCSIFEWLSSQILIRFLSIFKLMLKKRKCQKCNTY